MSDCAQWSLRRQVEWFRTQYAQQDRLPFSEVLTRELILETLYSLGHRFYNSLYNPVTTLWLFLTQVIAADPSLGATVEGFLAWRLSQGLPRCSTDNSAYGKARGRLSEVLLQTLTRVTGRTLAGEALSDWLWQGRHVKLFDGSTVSMPDTQANQNAYPQPASQRPGVGFPLARIGVLFSLSVGSVLDFGICKWKGKFQSELGLLRAMFDAFSPGDILLTDRYLCSYMEIAVLHSRGVDVAARMHAHRDFDFRRGRKLGLEDHIVLWNKPPRPAWMSLEDYQALPKTMPIRELRYRLAEPGFRVEEIVLATTLLDAEAYPWEEVAELYGLRWDAEINLRSLKTLMQMDVLRGQSPEMVRKEIWAHLLAYNLIRTVIAQAAAKHGLSPRNISFKRAMRSVEQFRSTLASADESELDAIYETLLDAIASHRIGQRPGRTEPRQVKRRPKPYKRMTVAREHARNDSK
jgi:hypothetical protein